MRWSRKSWKYSWHVLHHGNYQSTITAGHICQKCVVSKSFLVSQRTEVTIPYVIRTFYGDKRSTVAPLMYDIYVKLTLDSLTELIWHVSHLTQWIWFVAVVFLHCTSTHNIPQTANKTAFQAKANQPWIWYKDTLLCSAAMSTIITQCALCTTLYM